MATTHAEIERRSLALHAAVAEKLAQDPAQLEAARGRVETWLREGSAHPEYARAWHNALSGPLEELLELLVDPGERAAALRQVSPFAGVLDPRERWEILRRHGLRC
jgi:hypothetical protein